ncbi:MAG: nuclear transport factor 2 family protein [Spartobacteria bacterium]
MKLLFFSVAPILFLGSMPNLFAQDPATPGGTAESLAAAEKAFAQEAVEKGTRRAFLNALSDDAIVFEPGPQNGKKVWEAKPEKGDGVLLWQPVLAATSTMGDLGYTTGPWTFQTDAGDKRSAAFGHFVSIWRWENGKWKVFLDIGSKNPRPTEPRAELQLVENHAPNESAADALPLMQAHDRRYTANRTGEMAKSAEENVWLYLPDKFPIVGREEAAAALQKASSPIKFGEPKANVSHGGDLGYLWGEYTIGAAPEPGGYYLRIWRKDRAGDWKLCLDLIHPR